MSFERPPQKPPPMRLTQTEFTETNSEIWAALAILLVLLNVMGMIAYGIYYWFFGG